MEENNAPFPAYGDEVIQAEGLRKIFALSRRQRALEKTNDAYRIAVDGLDFRAYRGEIYGLLGPNGAGKTTTLRMLSTLIKPDAGDAFVCGYSVCKQPDKVRDGISADKGVARIGLDESGEHAQRRRLARTVGTEQPVDLAAVGF